MHASKGIVHVCSQHNKATIRHHHHHHHLHHYHVVTVTSVQYHIIVIIATIVIITTIISIIIISIIVMIVIVMIVIVISARAARLGYPSPLPPPHISLCSCGPQPVVSPRAGGLDCLAPEYLRQRGSAYE
jgi:hypothetical protein